MQISLKFENATATATLLDNETASDFVALLPLTLTVEILTRPA